MFKTSISIFLFSFLCIISTVKSEKTFNLNISKIDFYCVYMKCKNLHIVDQ